MQILFQVEQSWFWIEVNGRFWDFWIFMYHCVVKSSVCNGGQIKQSWPKISHKYERRNLPANSKFQKQIWIPNNLGVHNLLKLYICNHSFLKISELIYWDQSWLRSTFCSVQLLLWTTSGKLVKIAGNLRISGETYKKSPKNFTAQLHGQRWNQSIDIRVD